MTQQLSALMAQYGLLLVFGAVLAEQIGVPVPALPVLVIAGALVAADQLPLAGIVLVALAGSLIPDLGWYGAGRHFGAGVMRTLCRVSLSRDSCIHNSERRFERWRGWSLVVAKFVPGLSLIAPPLAGASGMPVRAFLLLDMLGALLWIGVAVGLGYAFSGQLDPLLAAIDSVGVRLFQIVLVLLALYVAARWWLRHRLRQALAMTRISASELHAEMAQGDAPIIVDVRSRISRELDPRVIDGALLADEDTLVDVLRDTPPERAIVTYCNCPNEATSAKAAKVLMQHGYRHVRPLQGGLAGWKEAGYPTRRLPAEASTVAGAEPQEGA